MLWRQKKVIGLMLVAILMTIAPAQASIGSSTSPTTLTIFAASSLTETFTALGKVYEAAHPGTKVQFSFLSSSTLATQLLSGAPADVFAAAAPVDMTMAGALILKPKAFVTNRVVLAIPQANPLHIARISDLNRPKVKWIQCAHQVPCGIAADAALAAEGTVTSKPESLEPKVTSAVTKILAGEVDAAIIYRTDVAAHNKSLRGISFKNVDAATTEYLIGAVAKSANLPSAKKFVELVLSAAGKKILYQAGFGRVK